MEHRLNTGALAFAAAVALAGCAGFGPERVTRDRFDYVGAISESWKQQMLLNLLKVRYSDAPVFLDVSSVIASYTIGATASVRGNTLPRAGATPWARSASAPTSRNDRRSRFPRSPARSSLAA